MFFCSTNLSFQLICIQAPALGQFSQGRGVGGVLPGVEDGAGYVIEQGIENQLGVAGARGARVDIRHHVQQVRRVVHPRLELGHLRRVQRAGAGIGIHPAHGLGNEAGIGQAGHDDRLVELNTEHQRVQVVVILKRGLPERRISFEHEHRAGHEIGVFGGHPQALQQLKERAEPPQQGRVFGQRVLGFDKRLLLVEQLGDEDAVEHLAQPEKQRVVAQGPQRRRALRGGGGHGVFQRQQARPHGRTDRQGQFLKRNRALVEQLHGPLRKVIARPQPVGKHGQRVSRPHRRTAQKAARRPKAHVLERVVGRQVGGSEHHGPRR